MQLTAFFSALTPCSTCSCTKVCKIRTARVDSKKVIVLLHARSRTHIYISYLHKYMYTQLSMYVSEQVCVCIYIYRQAHPTWREGMIVEPATDVHSVLGVASQGAPLPGLPR